MLRINSLNQHQTSFKSKVSSSKFDTENFSRLLNYCESKSIQTDIVKTSLQPKVERKDTKFINKIYRATSEKLAEQKFLKGPWFIS